jgi:hypothetical protein
MSKRDVPFILMVIPAESQFHTRSTPNNRVLEIGKTLGKTARNPDRIGKAWVFM